MTDRIFFSDIFYPADPDSLSSMTKADEKQDVHTPGLILLPHAHLDSIAGMYRDAFSLIHNPERIVVIAPLHAEVMESDSGTTLFTYEAGVVETPIGKVTLEEAPGAKVSNAYAEEEYSIELFYPFIAQNCPKAHLMPILASLDTKEDVLTLARVIGKLKREENNTVFIVSGNFTGEGQGDAILKQARMLQQLLENNAPLLEAVSRKHITGCACRILEATRTTTGGSFRIKEAHCGSYTGNDISDSADGNIWQVYAIKD